MLTRFHFGPLWPLKSRPGVKQGRARLFEVSLAWLRRAIADTHQVMIGSTENSRDFWWALI